jgi:hypothetical protein
VGSNHAGSLMILSIINGSIDCYGFSFFLGIFMFFLMFLFNFGVHGVFYRFHALPCNVPTLGHHYITKCYDGQSSQMEVIESTEAIEGYFGVQLASIILFHHHDPFHTAWFWFRCIPTISMILSYFGL